MDITNEVPLRARIEELLVFKRSSGYKADGLAKILHRFINYAEEWEPGLTTVTKSVAEKWATMSPYEAPANQCRRIGSVKELSKYLISIGIPAYVYPKQKAAPSSFTPYIFTDEELAKLFNACDNTKTPNLVRKDVVSLIFRMIYSCGLRASEALSLTVRDVDLVQGTIFIKDSKFGKERLLPVHDNLLKRMKIYHSNVLAFCGPDAPFFPNGRNGAYTTGGLYSIFRERLLAAGISHGGKGNGPRVHDLRHTFAVHSLRKAVKNGEDINSMLKYLSVYLGHSGVISSENYLRLTADVYPDIICKMEGQFDVIPDMEDTNETD